MRLFLPTAFGKKTMISVVIAHPGLSKAEGLTTNGEGSLCPFVLSLSKDRLFCKDGFEIVSKSPQRPLQRGISTLAGLLTTFKEQLIA